MDAHDPATGYFPGGLTTFTLTVYDGIRDSRSGDPRAPDGPQCYLAVENDLFENNGQPDRRISVDHLRAALDGAVSPAMLQRLVVDIEGQLLQDLFANVSAVRRRAQKTFQRAHQALESLYPSIPRGTYNVPRTPHNLDFADPAVVDRWWADQQRAAPIARRQDFWAVPAYWPRAFDDAYVAFVDAIIGHCSAAMPDQPILVLLMAKRHGADVTDLHTDEDIIAMSRAVAGRLDPARGDGIVVWGYLKDDRPQLNEAFLASLPLIRRAVTEP